MIFISMAISNFHHLQRLNMAKLSIVLVLVVVVGLCFAHPYEEKHQDKQSHLHKKHGDKRDIIPPEPVYNGTEFPTPYDAPIGGDASIEAEIHIPIENDTQWVYIVKNDQIIPVHIEDTNEYYKITGNPVNQIEDPYQNQDISQNAIANGSKRHGHYKRFAVAKPADLKKHGHENKHGHDDKRAHHEKHGHELKKHGHEDRKLQEKHHHQY